MNNKLQDVVFQAKLDDFLSQFNEDEQEKLLQYALDHILPRLRGVPVRNMFTQEPKQ